MKVQGLLVVFLFLVATIIYCPSESSAQSVALRPSPLQQAFNRAIIETILSGENLAAREVLINNTVLDIFAAFLDCVPSIDFYSYPPTGRPNSQMARWVRGTDGLRLGTVTGYPDSTLFTQAIVNAMNIHYGGLISWTTFEFPDEASLFVALQSRQIDVTTPIIVQGSFITNGALIRKNLLFPHSCSVFSLQHYIIVNDTFAATVNNNVAGLRSLGSGLRLCVQSGPDFVSEAILQSTVLPLATVTVSDGQGCSNLFFAGEVEALWNFTFGENSNGLVAIPADAVTPFSYYFPGTRAVDRLLGLAA